MQYSRAYSGANVGKCEFNSEFIWIIDYKNNGLIKALREPIKGN
jgi:hypothetical protein